MYQSSATPLLTCQRDNAARKEACSSRRRDAVAQLAIDGRIALFNTLSAPAAIAQQFGAQTGADAMAIQEQSEPARAAILLGTETLLPVKTVSVQEVIATAPKSVSLNGQPSQVNGCAWALPPPVPVGVDPVPTMPLVAPVVVQTPLGPVSLPPPISPDRPAFTNLCWALRNGAVDASQFEAAELQSLQYRCMQLGYTGACPPPPNTNAYLNIGRSAHNLPHISVSADVLDSLIPATDMGGLTCPDSYRRAGLTGYAPTWADAFAEAGAGGPGGDGGGVMSWFSDHPWLTLALAAGGAVALSRRNGR